MQGTSAEFCAKLKAGAAHFLNPFVGLPAATGTVDSFLNAGTQLFCLSVSFSCAPS